MDFKCLLIFIVFNLYLALAIKFDLNASKYPETKCIWHYANSDTLVVVTANINTGHRQRVDLDILDGSHENFTYLSKKDIKGETRLAITTHNHAEIGVCLRNFLVDSQFCFVYYQISFLSLQRSIEVPAHLPDKYTSTVDLDIDVGAEAIDYNAIANQEHLSTIETDMRKLEQMTREIVADMNYLKKREERMRDTNGQSMF